MAGIDLKPIIDLLISWIGQYWPIGLGVAVVFLLFKSTGFFARLRRVIEELFFTNWQLAVLGSTAIALSLASGYTTWDGLRNFTAAPWLSFLIAFGIQGVMLIVAWIIGESFATGMSHRAAGARLSGWKDATTGILLGTALLGIVFYWTLVRFDALSFTKTAQLRTDWARIADISLYFTAALVVVAVAVFSFRRGGDLATPYVQSARLIVKNAVLWVMFLATGTASVFFSFDSHFNAIFPADQRKRAAEIRTTAQVGAVLSDIGALTQKRQIEEAENLFNSDGWRAYETQLAKLASVSQGSQGEIERYFIQKMEDRRRGIVEQQERIAGAERSQTALLRKRDELEAELQRLQPGIGALEDELAKAQSVYDETKQKIAAKRIEASAEAGGVEGTLKQGKGPVYRERMAELDALQRKLSITDEPRLKEAQKNRDQVSARIVGLKREIATINAEVAKYKGEAQTAAQLIKVTESSSADEQGPKLDPARVLPAFERARNAFRQQPDTERLVALQQQCQSLLVAMSSTEATKNKVRDIDCDPKQAADAAGRVFALNAGLAAFQANCAGGDKLARYTTTDSLLSFGRKCLQDSGLVSADSTNIGARLAGIDMNRDDKAHRFVVTWNAFLDGNRLAYLALALAIGVDSLIFLAGLFGANAIKSPLSDVPSPKARSAEQLEAIVKNALGEDRLENAELVLAAMEPLSGEDGFHAEIDLRNHDPETARRIRKVLVAGSSIGAVKRASRNGQEERYHLRSEFFEYLSVVANTARESDSEYANRKRLIQIVGVALEPDRRTNSEIVLRYIEPINQRHGFMAKVDLETIADVDRRLVQNVLNAGMTLNAVQRHDRGGRRSVLGARFGSSGVLETTYLVRADLFKTLLLYKAGSSALLTGDHGDSRPPAKLTAEPALRLPNEPLPRMLGNGRRHANGNGILAQDLEHQFQEGLMAALDLTPASLDKIWAPEIAGEAVAAGAALKRQARANPALSRELRLIETDNERVLREAQDLIAARYADDPQSLSTLDEVAAQIVRRLPALMLLPEGGLIQRLISALEEAHAEDALSDREHLLLSRLRKLRGDIERMNPSDAADWKRIARQLEALNDPTSTPTIPAAGGAQIH